MSGAAVARMSDIVYLDYAATTPVDPLVVQVMQECLGLDGDFANPSSILHAAGRRADARVQLARAQVAGLLSADPREILFTSGATESNNLAILGLARANADRGRHVVTSRIEHKAVLDPCARLEKEGFQVTYVHPDRTGRVDPQAVRDALRDDTVLVSIMHVNNETGVIQDIAAIGRFCRERGIPFHTDAAQSAGRLLLDVRSLPVDLLSFTAHKIYGPKGIGALYVRESVRPLLQPVTFGGGQERGMRPGTLPTHQIAGFGMACELAERNRADEQRQLALLRDRLWEGLTDLAGVHLNGEAAPRVANILNVSFEGVEGESLITGLTRIAVSTGSACSSASGEPSYVLRALGRDTQLAQSSLRFSLGRFTSESDVERAIEAVRREVTRLRAVSPRIWPVQVALGQATPDLAGGGRPGHRGRRSGGTGESYTFTIASGGEAGVHAERTEPEDAALLGPDPLSPAVRHYFQALAGAGPITRTDGEVVRGEAGDDSQEAWVRFHLLVDGDNVKDARFQAYGCPHTLATASWLTERLPGRKRADLVPGTPTQWADDLGVPVEKLGRLLVVEDALRACLRRWPG